MPETPPKGGTMSQREDLFDLPWQEFRDNIRDVQLLTHCFPIGPNPAPDDEEAWERQRFIHWRSYSLKKRFEAGDQLAGIEAYLFLTEERYRVPNWINYWLHAAFKQFHESKGKNRDLCKLLGMETRQKTGNPYSRKLMTDRNYRIAHEVEDLRFLTRCGIEKCCEVLSCHKDPTPDYYDPIDYPSPKRIFRIHEAWKGSPEHSEQMADIELPWGREYAVDCLMLYHQAMIDAARRPDCAFSEQDRLSIFEKNPFFQPLPLSDDTTP